MNPLNMKSGSGKKLHISGPLQPQLEPTEQTKKLIGKLSLQTIFECQPYIRHLYGFIALLEIASQ